LRAHVLDVSGGEELLRDGGLIQLEDTVAGHVFRTGTPRVGDVEGAQQRGLAAGATWAALGGRVGCVVPLISRQRSGGTLETRRGEAEAYRADEVQCVTQIAGQLAMAVENARVYEEVRELKDKLVQEKLYVEAGLCSERNFEEIIGQSVALRRVLQQVETV